MPLFRPGTKKKEAGGPVAQLLRTANSTAGTGTYTSASHLGGSVVVPSAGLIVVAGFISRGSLNRDLGTITFNGVNLNTASQQIRNASGLDGGAAIGWDEVSAGTYSFSLAESGAQVASRAGVAIWLVTGYTDATPKATGQNSISGVNSRTLGLTYAASPAIGFYVGHLVGQDIFNTDDAPSMSSGTIDYSAGEFDGTGYCFGRVDPFSGSPHSETISFDPDASADGMIVGIVVA